MNTLGFAGISGRLRPGRKKIPRKKGAFKRVINDISGFSREASLPPAPFSPFSRRPNLFESPRDLRDSFDIKALTRLRSGGASPSLSSSAPYFHKFPAKQSGAARFAESDSETLRFIVVGILHARNTKRDPLKNRALIFRHVSVCMNRMRLKTRG